MKTTYESPTLELIEVQVEQGFNGSGNGDGGMSLPGWEII